MLIIDLLPIILSVFILIFLVSGIKVLKEWERIVILRLGKYRGMKGPGLVWRFPILDRIGARVSMRLQTVEIDTGEVASSDGTPVRLVGEVRYRVVDVERVVLSLEDYQTTAQQSSRHVAIEQIEFRNYNELVTNKERVESAVARELDSRLEKWGMAVVGVDLRVQRSSL
ncbi:MAG: SPFH domain-containing protein [Candidatus Thorarchaeota archaeon]|jgi:regulator of protease activity HflC (stomatin/prohibitin superfamily)